MLPAPRQRCKSFLKKLTFRRSRPKLFTDYQKGLREHGLKPSISGKGNCLDNAVVETFLKTIKAMLIWRRTWETRR
jgi:transposase InsO family protein